MPRFSFDVRDSKGVYADPEGLEFETLEAAVLEARKTIHEMEAEVRAADGSALSIEIRGAKGSLVTVVTSTAVLPSWRLAQPSDGAEARGTMSQQRKF